MQKTVCSLPFSIFINPCALIATVEMMGNQMAEIEDFKIDLKPVQRELQIKGSYV